jgi:hypothetical protein
MFIVVKKIYEYNHEQEHEAMPAGIIDCFSPIVTPETIYHIQQYKQHIENDKSVLPQVIYCGRNFIMPEKKEKKNKSCKP